MTLTDDDNEILMENYMSAKVVRYLNDWIYKVKKKKIGTW